MKIGKWFEFEASHKLPDKEEYGACRNLHGHTYKLLVEIEGPVKEEFGWVCNFKDLKSFVNQAVIDKLDHSHLNDYLDIPTCENLVGWIYFQLDQGPYYISRLKLFETSTSYAEWTHD